MVADTMNVRRVGVGELKAKLSAFLRLVQQGDIVVVTDRGREIAEIRKPGRVAPGMSAYEKMVAAGRIVPPTDPDASLDWLYEPGPKLPPGTAQRHIGHERGD
ncbi:MAG: type II toxin-antitoxin system prevent-host-death family antitoxin [Candidatus Sericytochromatia bacterium]|uniref:Type II toxin-antitoxin system prevent-host-death family antitoxin n=1 Tax=Candidatus Tanganyikabacteria bacterium TaxID=2961651 RepID=A0A938BN95_9BACT|nr:type II toxin-antitoxin system prevent-host-death family antitoxin [Candidatus Tanganyikabacteria bacterium]